MTRRISPTRVAVLVSGFHHDPAYRGLADALRLAIGDGRIAHDTQLPSERDLTAVLGLSRTTVTRAYAALRDGGYAIARQGSGTFTRIPGGPNRIVDRALSPRPDDDVLIDLNCAAASATPVLVQAYQAAVADLPAYLSGHGYYPAGLPTLQRAVAERFCARGLPTDADQIMITPGALGASAIAAHALVRAGDRVLVESPVYPNAPRAFAAAGARSATLPVGEEGWDLDGLGATVRRATPTLAYVIPDFQNPTGHLLGDAGRERLSVTLTRAGTTVVIDEAHQELSLDGQEMPAPLAAHVERAGGLAVTVGGVSKTAWGGLRVGWLRAPHHLIASLTEARLALDLGVPVIEQLVVAGLLTGPADWIADHRERLRVQRDALTEAVRDQLPQWRFRRPTGGLSLWCELPEPRAAELAARAEERGVILAPGPVFAPEGGLNGNLRIPYTRPVDDLHQAVAALADAWQATTATGDDRRLPSRPMVA